MREELMPAEADLAENDLVIEELEDRTVPGVHGGCACTCSCDCTSCSCIIIF